MGRWGIVAREREILRIDDVRPWLLTPRAGSIFTQAEWAYAASKSDPERRLAARLAAKRAAARALPGVSLGAIEVVRRPGHAPTLALSSQGLRVLRERGATHALVSLAHDHSHAAALVLLVAD